MCGVRHCGDAWKWPKTRAWEPLAWRQSDEAVVKRQTADQNGWTPEWMRLFRINVIHIVLSRSTVERRVSVVFTEAGGIIETQAAMNSKGQSLRLTSKLKKHKLQSTTGLYSNSLWQQGLLGKFPVQDESPINWLVTFPNCETFKSTMKQGHLECIAQRSSFVQPPSPHLSSDQIWIADSAKWIR